VKVMAGTDSFDSFCFYGSALHDELGYLVAAGLTPLEALQAATVVPAEYAHREKDFGAIAAGRVADLVLLDGNPLADIAQVRAVRGVAFNGRYFDRAALDAILAEVRTAAAGGALPK
jgi:imidazolonepropionase-like amidohydrolase